MWEKKVTKHYKGITPEQVWHVCKDVNSWPSWWMGLKKCELHGEFMKGNTFTLTPSTGPATEVKIVDVQENQLFMNEGKFFGATMNDGLIIEEGEHGTALTTFVKMQGPLRWIWVQLLGKKIIGHAAQSMDQLISIVRDESVTKHH